MTVKNLLTDNYLIVKNFISKKRAKSISEELLQENLKENYSSDSQVPGSPAVYNSLPILELLTEKTPKISNLVGESVFPTYCYSRIYQNGCELEKHTDREECEISMTLHLDGDEDWEFFIENKEGKEECIVLKPGDGIIYLGCDAPHWRKSYKGKFYTQSFLHYVLKSGKNAKRYFDRENKSFDTIKTNISDFVLHEENFLDSDFCDFILEEYSNTDYWTKSKTDAGENQEIRNCEGISISSNDVIFGNVEVRKQIDEKLFTYVNKLAKLYLKNYPEQSKNLNLEEDSGYNLLRYHEGGFYIQHTDSYKQEPRNLTVIFNLNDEYEGGDIAFFDRKKIIKAKKGDAIIFPSNFLYPHEILPVISGTRYSIVTWLI